MAGIIQIYYYICLAVGLINLHYHSQTHSLQLFHWPTLLYVGLQNISALAFQPYAIILYFRTTYYCLLFDALAMMNCLLTLAHDCAIIATIAESWLKRKRLRKLCYRGVKLVKLYFSESKISSNYEAVKWTRKMVLRKIISSFFKVVVLYVHLYKRINVEGCDYMQDGWFIVTTIYMGYLALLLVCCDIYANMGLLLTDLCLRMLLGSLNTVYRDIRLMSKSNGEQYNATKLYIHRQWRRQLASDVDRIALEIRNLHAFANEHVALVQLPLLFLLLSTFLNLISLTFDILANLSEVQNSQSILLMMILAANISSSMVIFNICESLKRNYRNMSQSVYEMSLRASTQSEGQFQGDMLVKSLEMLAGQLRRQPFKVSVCGLFEINHSTAFRMLTKIVLNLLCLVQMVVQDIIHHADDMELKLNAATTEP